MLAFPVEMLSGLVERRARGPALLGVAVAYVASAATVALTVWRAGVRRFSAFGG